MGGPGCQAGLLPRDVLTKTGRELLQEADNQLSSSLGRVRAGICQGNLAVS